MIYLLKGDVWRWLGISKEECLSDLEMEFIDNLVVEVRYVYKFNIWICEIL